MEKDFTADRIVYLVISKPGGIDGRDTSDKGGKMLKATFDKQDAYRTGSINEIKAIVVEPKKVREEALAKLTPLEKLILGI